MTPGILVSLLLLAADGDFAPDQSKLPAPAPEDAVVLFDGKDNNLFLSMAGEKPNWPVEDGVTVSTRGGNTNHIVSKLHFRDADIHVEFMLPEEGPGNSGVYIHGNYEMQIFNSHGKETITKDDTGAVYGFAPPLVNACRPPGEWQVFDIRYRAPHRDASGQIVEEGTITAWLNGKKVQDGATFGEPRSVFHPFRHGTTPYLKTIWERQKQTMTGPVFLQDHGNPVKFRNVWVRPLDDHAFIYEPAAFPLNAKRILFLGDSITHNGGYVAWVETQLRLHGVDPLPEFINIGLSSETLSGLSEPGHPFPRPDVHERLGRALEKIKPDVVVACYGMNDGIYHPFGEERFRAYRDGVNRLVKKAQDAGAKVILMTPPPYDPVPVKDSGRLKPAGEKVYGYTAPYENYDDVLARYGEWVMGQKDRVAMVIDLHTPLTRHVAGKRKENLEFTVAPDAVHPNAEGHRVMGNAILRAWGIDETVEPDPELLRLVGERLSLLHDGWLGEVGHKHPGYKSVPTLEEARAKAAELEKRIEGMIKE